MRLAIFWHDLLPYHLARLKALSEAGQANGHSIQGFILCAAATPATRDAQQALGEQLTILSQDPTTAGEFSHHSKQQLLTALDHLQPDAVAIIGYTGLVTRAALGWCRYHRRGAILMLSSQRADYSRVWWREWPKRQLVSYYDAAFVSGKPQLDYARQLGVPTKRIATGYGVVDNDFWRAGAATARGQARQIQHHYGVPSRFFLTACRFVPKKNLTGLLNAYARYVAQTGTAPWGLVLVGDGELAPQLRQQVATLGLADLVHFLGYLPAPEMAAIYGVAAAFVLPSAYAEQWGLVVNEAMAAGLPVLVSKICGCVADLVIEGETGFTFDPTNEQVLADLLGSITQQESLREHMGRKAQQHIQHYSPARFAQNLFSLAETAIQHAQTRRWPLWPVPTNWF
ncbi:MAG: glycosyltransferase [Caldilineaceae bacterium]|nr:glycosyltransferase [Caldilineaceae bacterium]